MALSFLGDIGGFVNAAMPAAKGIANLMSVFGKSPYDKALKAALNEGPTPAEQRSAALYESLIEPNNSLVAQLSQDEYQRGAANLIGQLRQMQAMDSRRLARGQRGTFFNPERADETVDYLTTRGLPAIRAQSRNSARERIFNSASALGGQAGLQNERQVRKLLALQSNAARQEKMGGYGGMIEQGGRGIQDIIGALQGIF